MINLKTIRKNLTQIFAITEKNIKFDLRFKFNLILSFITPIFGIIFPLIIMGQLFRFRSSFGEWTANNFIIYQFIAYNIALINKIISSYQRIFSQEKYWETLPALIIAPFKRINLVLGIFFFNLIMITIPFSIFLTLSYFIYPILPLTFLFVLGLYFLTALIFSGIGIIMGVFAISKEGFLGLLNFLLTFVFWFSCLSYPFYIFPEFLQKIIALNPFYHIFDTIRLSWIENNVILSITSHPYSFLILISGAIFIPLIGVFIFNKIFRKYGIVGY